MRYRTLALVAGTALARTLVAQPSASYTLRVNAADLSGFDVEMRVRNAVGPLRLAMSAHPEYDDRYWRFVEGLRAEAAGRAVAVVREDSALWRLAPATGTVVVRWRIHLPPQVEAARRAAWRPFLAPTGGLVGGPHSFLYIVGAEQRPAQVALDLPAAWAVATSLESGGGPRAFTAPDAKTLVEAPMLVGQFRQWRFAVAGVPHRIVYWPLPGAAPFDTAAFVSGVERITRQAIALFGRAPWRAYTFLFQDGSSGALEHANSVTIGAPSADLARNPGAYFGETAHEFFHAWNLMRIRPLHYGELDYRPTPMSKGLWFSEGLSMFYSEVLRLRAGLPLPDSTRALHLANLIARYLSSPGSSRLSAERVSEAAYATTPGTLGDYDASTHLQGELIGAMLDFIIRDATGGRRSVDDLMRAMMERHGTGPGFTSADVEHLAASTCACDVTPFFDAHVRGGTPIEFGRYLGLAGLRVKVTWGTALDPSGAPSVDRRIRAWLPDGAHALRLITFNPASAWGRAGLHTGDQLTALNGAPVSDVAQFRTWLGTLKVGDTVRVDVARPSGPIRATVVLNPYDRPYVTVDADPAATPKQRKIRDQWSTARP